MADQPESGIQPQEASEASQEEQLRERTGVDQPAKLLRIASAISQVLPEIRDGSLDEETRHRLAEMQRGAVAELKEILDPDLAEELDDITLPVEEGETPSGMELQIAQAQLTGWLDGLLRGIQAAFMAQQAQAQQQLGQLRQQQQLGRGGEGSPGAGQYL